MRWRTWIRFAPLGLLSMLLLGVIGDQRLVMSDHW